MEGGGEGRVGRKWVEVGRLEGGVCEGGGPQARRRGAPPKRAEPVCPPGRRAACGPYACGFCGVGEERAPNGVRREKGLYLRAVLWYNRGRKHRKEMEDVPTLNIVLVEPRIPQNVGNIARTCAATGARLHLVEPMAFTIDDAKLRRAGLDYWQYLDVTTYPSLEDFMEKNRAAGERMYYFTTKAQHIYTEVQYPDDCWLLFGREDAGLPEELLVQHPGQCLRFPMRQGLRSLNLSNSVAIGVYEALRQWDFPLLQNKGTLHRLNWG